MTRWLFISDVDDTLLGDEAALGRLAARLRPARPAITVAYNSSRPCASLRQTLRAVASLPRPDYLIGALGTELEHAETGAPVLGATLAPKTSWKRDAIFALVTSMGFEPHAPEYQTALKASFHVPGRENLARVTEALARARLEVQVIYSGGQNLDLIPAGAGKGRAAERLRRHLAFEADQVVVAGDSANDVDMLTAEFKGIVVANAAPVLQALRGERIYHARAPYAAGVLEGLAHWGVLPRPS